MDRVDYQVKIAEILDEALTNLNTDEFDILIDSIEEVIEDYN